MLLPNSTYMLITADSFGLLQDSQENLTIKALQVPQINLHMRGPGTKNWENTSKGGKDEGETQGLRRDRYLGPVHYFSNFPWLLNHAGGEFCQFLLNRCCSHLIFLLLSNQ
jgi:hypothetical protein